MQTASTANTAVLAVVIRIFSLLRRIINYVRFDETCYRSATNRALARAENSDVG